MAFVVTDRCIDCKFTKCAAICPVDAFREASDRLFIEPDVCIDCNACVPECPVHAIFAEHEVPAQRASAIALNRAESKLLPVIAEERKALKGPKCIKPRHPNVPHRAL